MLVPRHMDKLGVRADCNYFSAEGDEIVVLLCQSSEFCRSDEGEISRIKKQDGPFALFPKAIQG